MRRMRSPCCARAANGHVAADPVIIPAMNSRRRIASPEAQDYAKLGFAISEAKQETWTDGMGTSRHLRRENAGWLMSPLGHVWTAPWQEDSDVLQHWSGAVTCPAC